MLLDETNRTLLDAVIECAASPNSPVCALKWDCYGRHRLIMKYNFTAAPYIQVHAEEEGLIG